MFCPQCKTEYKEGLKRCTDCGAILVPHLTASPKATRSRLVDWVTVLESNNAGVIMVAKSILEGAGIKHYVVGEDLQNLFGTGNIIFNPFMERIKIQVDRDDSEAAKILLAELG